MDDEEKDKHPSYGLIGLARCHAGGRGVRLFASRLPGHETFIKLTIREASLDFRLKEERASGAGGKVVAEVWLSSVQFAEMLTNMNVGDGVPCTIVYSEAGGQRELPPALPGEPERIRESFRKDMEKAAVDLEAAAAEAEAAMGDKVPKKVRDLVTAAFRRGITGLKSNAPFAVEQFERSTEKVAAAAKAEVDAFIATATTKMGLAALRDTGVARKLLSRDDEE